MSGGHFEYQDMHLGEWFEHVEQLPIIMAALEEAFHRIDWAESGDTDRKDEESKVYNIILKLGQDLFYRK